MVLVLKLGRHIYPMSLAWSYRDLGTCRCMFRISCSLLCDEWIIWSPYLRFWLETQLILSLSADLTFNNEIIFFCDPYEPDRSRTTSKTLLTDMENDATKDCPCCSFLCMSMKGERGTSKGRVPALQHEALALEYSSVLYKGKQWHSK